MSAVGVDINAFMSIGVQGAIEELLPAFEKASGDTVAATWGTGAVLNRRVAGGAAVDVLISTRTGIDELLTTGAVTRGSDVDLARSRIGVAVRRGAPKPDISTPDALRRSLLAARAISYSDPAAGGVSGVHFARVLEQLGIAGAMKARTRFPPPSGFSASLVARGEADLAVQQIPELSVAGVELVGPLPDGLQLVTTFTAALPATARQREAAAAFVRFLQSREAVAVMKAKGLESPTSNPW
jgi:molybdate transport system substrate-binding protein